MLLATLVATGIGGCVGDSVTQTVQAPVDPKERDCLLRAMYFESNRSSYDGMLAVGTVVMNRKESGMFPSTVCGVVGQARQFAAGALSRSVSPRESAFAERAADDVMAGKRHDNMKNVMYFHTAGLHFRYPNMHYHLVAGGNAFYERYPRHPRAETTIADATAAPASLAPPDAPTATTAVAQTTLAYAATVPSDQSSSDRPSALTLFLANVASGQSTSAASTQQNQPTSMQAAVATSTGSPAVTTGEQSTWATSFLAGAASSIAPSDAPPAGAITQVQSEPAAPSATPSAGSSDAAPANGPVEYIR